MHRVDEVKILEASWPMGKLETVHSAKTEKCYRADYAWSNKRTATSASKNELGGGQPKSIKDNNHTGF